MATETREGKQQVIISLTSFPQAIRYTIPTIKSILAGSVLPDKIVLYLTYSQFTDISIPEELLKLAKENPIFEIRNYDREIRSYRKLIPALLDFPDAVIVTIDDDTKYHRDMLRILLKYHSKYPEHILAHRARVIVPESHYKGWKKYRWYHFLFKKQYLSFKTMQTGVGGVLYPPHSLCKEMMNPDLFTTLAPTTDDIWFWAMGVANGRMVMPIPFGQNKPKGVGKPRELSLKTVNFKSAEDRNSTALKAILKQYPIVKQRLYEE